MDHLMPEMDGFEATQALRADPKYANLPIIMCTGKDHDGYLVEAQAIGANQILSKPPVDEALQSLLAADFAVNNDVAELIPELEEVLVDEEVESLEASSIGAEAPILDMEMLGGDDLLDESFIDEELTKDVLADFTSDSLDIGTNVLQSSAAKAEKAEPNESLQPKPAAAVETPQLDVSVDTEALKSWVAATVDAAKQEASEQLEKAVNAANAHQVASESKLQSIFAAMISDAISSMPLASGSPAPLPQAEIEALCQSFIANERISLVAEVLASVPEPKLPEFDVPRVDYDKVDAQLAMVKAELVESIAEKSAAVQESLQSQLHSLINDGLKTTASDITEDKVVEIANALASEKANAAGAAIAADFNQQLKQREKILLQHLEVNKAATAGLLTEMQAAEPGVSVPAEQHLTDEIDILREQQQQQLANGASKAIAYSGLAMGAIALGVAVWSLIA
jgi:CheY-like chemotaxis protein